jgi:hypothetical protein
MIWLAHSKRLLLLIVLTTAAAASAQMSMNGNTDSGTLLSRRPLATKIAEAMSAGPAAIAKDARIAEVGPGGELIELRPGKNSWTCMPKQSDTLPPMCADPASMQWMNDFGANKPKPTNTVPGITYMLAGATQRSDSDPYDKTSPLIAIGPHWMIMWPFDPKTSGLPTTHRANGSYIMWGGSPYAHVHVMGSPFGNDPASRNSK